jgi:serine/arginine repetitive matrix protein 1
VEDSRALTKALRGTKFPACFSTPVQLSKVNRAVLAQWIEQKIMSILGFEDDIVQSTAINLFLPEALDDGSSTRLTTVDPRKAQIDMAGFLGEVEAAAFANETWELMLDAQESQAGIPRRLVEEKKKELAELAMRQVQSVLPPPPKENVAEPIPRNDRREHIERRSRPVSPTFHEEASRRSGQDERDGQSGRRHAHHHHHQQQHQQARNGDERRVRQDTVGGRSDHRYNIRHRDEYEHPITRDDDRRRHDSRSDRRDNEFDSYGRRRERGRGEGTTGSYGDRRRGSGDRHGGRELDIGRRRRERSRSRSRSRDRHEQVRRRYSSTSSSRSSSSEKR